MGVSHLSSTDELKTFDLPWLLLDSDDCNLCKYVWVSRGGVTWSCLYMVIVKFALPILHTFWFEFLSRLIKSNLILSDIILIWKFRIFWILWNEVSISCGAKVMTCFSMWSKKVWSSPIKSMLFDYFDRHLTNRSRTLIAKSFQCRIIKWTSASVEHSKYPHIFRLNQG